jgi:ppGpp synthetase/RelA/SpoT-type nucleotidyltranferase
MDFETYERVKRPDYAALAETVASILAAAVRAAPNLRLQQVQHREKDPERLKQKLEDRGCLNTTSLEADIKDLAGCRLVFKRIQTSLDFSTPGLFAITSKSTGIEQESTIRVPTQRRRKTFSFRTTTLWL